MHPCASTVTSCNPSSRPYLNNYTPSPRAKTWSLRGVGMAWRFSLRLGGNLGSYEVETESALIRPEPEGRMVITIYSTNILKYSLSAKTYGRCWDTMANMPRSHSEDLECLPGPSVGCVFKRTQMKGHPFFKRRQENGRGLISLRSTLLAIPTPRIM